MYLERSGDLIVGCGIYKNNPIPEEGLPRADSVHRLGERFSSGSQLTQAFLSQENLD